MWSLKTWFNKLSETTGLMPLWGLRLDRDGRLNLLVDAEGWVSVQAAMHKMTSGWLPAEQPLQWLECAVLEPSLEGKWERGRCQRWLESQELSLLC